jgi:hypothetical protein
MLNIQIIQGCSCALSGIKKKERERPLPVPSQHLTLAFQAKPDLDVYGEIAVYDIYLFL